MKKLVIEKENVELHKSMNKKKLYLNHKKAESCKKDALKQLDILSKTLNDLESILNKLSLKKAFGDEYNNFAVQCSKKCAAQAQAARSLKENFEFKYNDDQKSILIQELDERISEIEKRLESIKG